jgi:hypothetical protein
LMITAVCPGSRTVIRGASDCTYVFKGTSYEFRISDTELTHLIALFYRSDFFRLANDYVPPPPRAVIDGDMVKIVRPVGDPSRGCTLALKVGNKTKVVANRGGYNPSLNLIEKYIEEIVRANTDT